MSQSWRDVVVALAGADAVLSVMDGADLDANVIAEVVGPDGLFRGRGASEEEAWRGVAHWLADSRLVQVLEAAGWSDVDEVVDETTYVVARDPAGAIWAIGVASADGDRRGYIERDIGYDKRLFDRIAFVEPLDTREPTTLLAALRAAD